GPPAIHCSPACVAAKASSSGADSYTAATVLATRPASARALRRIPRPSLSTKSRGASWTMRAHSTLGGALVMSCAPAPRGRVSARASPAAPTRPAPCRKARRVLRRVLELVGDLAVLGVQCRGALPLDALELIVGVYRKPRPPAAEHHLEVSVAVRIVAKAVV